MRPAQNKSFLVLFFKEELLPSSPVLRLAMALIMACSMTPAGAAATGKHKTDPVYHLIGFVLNGTDRVDTKALVAALPQHKGDIITHEQIKEDADRIGAALTAHHVHGNMTTATLEREGKGHYILVVWDVHVTDVLSNIPYNGPRHFGGQTFSGNVKLSEAQLAAATELQPGQDMPDGSIGDARTGIEQAYDKVLAGKSVDVKGKVIVKKDHTILIHWQIDEPK
jgi:outer membrane protein assembly factor BamA